MEHNFANMDFIRLETAYEHAYSATKKPLEAEQFWSSICVEPIPSNSHYRIESRVDQPETDDFYVDIESTSNDIDLDQISSKPATESSNFLLDSFHLTGVDELFPLVFPHQTPTSNKTAWITPVQSIIRRMEKFLYRVNAFNTLKSKKELRPRTIARKIRQLFSSTNFNLEMCVFAHHHLLEMLADNLLLLYMEGFAELWRQNKINKILTLINLTMRDRKLLKRFPYQRFILRVVPSQSVQQESLNSLPAICRMSNSVKNPNAAALGCRPIWNLKSQQKFPVNLSSLHPYPSAGPYFSWNSLINYSTAPSSSSLQLNTVGSTALPVFACITYPSSRSSSRIAKILKHLSDLGRVSLDTPEEQSCDTFRLRLRYFTRRVISLLEEPRNGPVFVVGFGLGSVLALISLLHLVNVAGVHLVSFDETDEAPHATPSHPRHAWLSGFICIGMPLLGLKGNRGSPLDPLLCLDRRFCGLLIIGAQSRLGNSDHVTDFRDKILAYQNSKQQGQQKQETLGADHLLRVRPSTAERWQTSQDAVDCSISFSIAHFVCDFKDFANTAKIIPNLASKTQQMQPNQPVVASVKREVKGRGSSTSVHILSEQPESPSSVNSIASSTGSMENYTLKSQPQSSTTERSKYHVVMSSPLGRTGRGSLSSPAQRATMGSSEDATTSKRFLSKGSYSNSPLASINRSTSSGHCAVNMPLPRRQQLPVPRVHHTTPSYLSLVQSQGRTMPRILQQTSTQQRRPYPILTSAQTVVRTPGVRYSAPSQYQPGLYLGSINKNTGLIPQNDLATMDSDLYCSPLAGSSRMVGAPRTSSSRRKVNHQALAPLDVVMQSPSTAPFGHKISTNSFSLSNSPGQPSTSQNPKHDLIQLD
ncbi:hypothetical protein Ciccas_008252 [Cichlidogyrus casuarinus]|uniref:Uncharacterized protein n=1 Tax=Cichlidogyrus casuarinus TaxID=1844966 RepID=A0ABD2Q0U0_9PLAT